MTDEAERRLRRYNEAIFSVSEKAEKEENTASAEEKAAQEEAADTKETVVHTAEYAERISEADADAVARAVIMRMLEAAYELGLEEE